MFNAPEVKTFGMERALTVRKKAEDIIGDGRKPTAGLISQSLEWSVQDVHRCLNYLEREGEVRTYRKEVMGVEHRFVGVNRT